MLNKFLIGFTLVFSLSLIPMYDVLATPSHPGSNIVSFLIVSTDYLDKCKTYHSVFWLYSYDDEQFSVAFDVPEVIDDTCGWTTRDKDWDKTTVEIFYHTSPTCTFTFTDYSQRGIAQSQDCGFIVSPGQEISVHATTHFADTFSPKTWKSHFNNYDME